MKRNRNVTTGLALIATLMIILAIAVPLWVQGSRAADDRPSWDKGMDNRMGRMGQEPKDVYMTIAVDGMTGSTANFAIMNMAMKGKEGNAVMIKPGAPLTGTYNTTNDMGYISTVNFMPATMTVDTLNNTSIPVAGASAVMGMHDMKVLAKEKGYKVFQFGEVSFFTPNGSAMTYKLDKPVRVTYEKDRNMAVIDAYPSFTRLMAEATGTGATFPPGAPPVPLDSLTTAKSAAMARTVGYEKPAYVAPPT